MNRIKFHDGMDLWAETFDYAFTSVFDEFKKTVSSLLHLYDIKKVGGILFGFEIQIQTSSGKIIIKHSIDDDTRRTSAAVDSLGRLIVATTSSGVIYSFDIPIKNGGYYPALYYEEEETEDQYNQVYDRFEKVKIVDKYEFELLTSSGYLNYISRANNNQLSSGDKRYIILGKITKTSTDVTGSEDGRIMLGAIIQKGQITDDMFSEALRIHQRYIQSTGN